MNKAVKCLFAATLLLAFALSWTNPFDGAQATGPYEDSLYIVKPEADSLHWGSKVIGSTPVVRTIRLLNHCPDTLIGTVYSTNACFKLNDSHDTLAYVIPDTNGVFEFTVSFAPTYRGVIDAFLWYTDPFDSTALYGSATGGTSPKPVGPSLYGTSPFSTATEAKNAYGQPQPDYTNGIFPVIIYGGATMEQISEGCLRAAIDSIHVVPDTTSGVVTSYSDSVCTHSVMWNTGNGITSHATTASGLPQGITTPVIVRVCRTNDPSCCEDSVTYITTLCGALSSPLELEIAAAPDSGFIAEWDTRTPTTDELRYRKSTDGSWTEGWVPSFPALAHAVHVAIPLSPSTKYYVETDGYDACDEHKGWSDSLAFCTDGDTNFVECPIECPTVVTSAFATQAISTTGATLHFHTDYTVNAHYRYHQTGNYPWVYRMDADADSLQHTISLAGLSAAITYTWQSNTKYTGCDSTAFADSTSFTTSCPTVATSAFATQAISTTGATLHFHTDLAAHAHFKYALYASSSYTYRHDADADSTQHTVAITGLTANYTRYKWLVNTKYSGCDSTAFGDQHDFYTTCNSVTPSDPFASYSAGHGNYFDVSSGSRTVKISVRFKRTLPIEGGYTTIYEMESTAVSGYRYCLGPCSTSASSTYQFEWSYIDECGTTVNWVSLGTWATNSSNQFSTSSGCGEE